MLIKLKTWYKKSTPLQQLSTVLFVYWIIWFIGSLLEDKIFYEASHPLTYHLFNATFMALFFTIFFRWNKVKAVFKSRSNNSVTNGLDKPQ